MSRIGKQPIEVPDKVEITLDGSTVKVKGPLGELTRVFKDEVEIVREGNVIHVTRKVETIPIPAPFKIRGSLSEPIYKRLPGRLARCSLRITG